MEPYLALKHGAASEEPIFFSVSEKKAMDTGTPGNLKNNNCWATPQGWVLVRDAAAASTYLMDNPAASTRKTIPLPHLPEDNLSTYCTCLLSDYYLDHLPAAASSSQRSSSILVLLVETDSPVIWYCRIGGADKRWEKFEYDIGIQDLSDLGDDGGGSEKLVICPIAACRARGKFYFNAGGEEVGVLEFRPAPVFSSITVRATADDEDAGLHKVFMVESGQELYRVSMLSSLDLETVYRVTVHRMDFAKQEWSTVEQLCGGGGGGDRAFLLSSWYFGASCSAKKCGLEKNCVYMANPWEQCVRVYNVEDGTTEVLELKEAPATDQALWMLPSTDQE